MVYILRQLKQAPQLFDEFEFEHLPPAIADALRINDHVFSTSSRRAPAQFARIVVKPNSRQLVFLFTGVGFGLMGPSHRFLSLGRSFKMAMGALLITPKPKIDLKDFDSQRMQSIPDDLLHPGFEFVHGNNLSGRKIHIFKIISSFMSSGP
jgi:hypothetical protein